MAEVRIAFYKASTHSWTDILIAGWTWIFSPLTRPYSHVEIGFYFDGGWQYFSSSVRDGGTRWKAGSDLLKNKDRWDVFAKNYADDCVVRMIARARALEGKAYDMLGILGFVTFTGQVLNDKNKWYCSETCYKVLTGLWKKRISPRRLSIPISAIFRPLKDF